MDKFVSNVYDCTKNFPKEEVFGLTSQMRRAAVSVAANIVEGCARTSSKELVNFLGIAFSSLRELGYFIDFSRRLGFLHEDKAPELQKKYDEAARVLSGLISSLRK